jgi:hypothetical protein
MGPPRGLWKGSEFVVHSIFGLLGSLGHKAADLGSQLKPGFSILHSMQ